MLDTPKAGWSRIEIGNWSDRCSYLDDVPYRLLETVDVVVRTGRPCAVRFDAEGWEYTMVFDQSETHILSDKTPDESPDVIFTLTTIDIRIRDIAKELITDLRKDVDGWANWMCYRPISEEELNERKKDILAWCDTLEQRVNYSL